MKRFPARIWFTLSMCLLPVLMQINPVFAQISSDETLSTPTTVIPSSGDNFEIKDGTQVGNNLFHSFREFSIPSGGSAVFNNAADISNIISRVTGGTISNIDGMIKANGNTNLFLLNPNGIIFGANASLNIGGSFLASTASSLIFADGSQFSAVPNNTSPLLTMSAPVGLQFGTTANPITVQSSNLAVVPSQTLALVGGNISIAGGILIAPGGRVELGSVASGNNVSLTPVEQGWELGYEGVKTFQDISLSQRARIDVTEPFSLIDSPPFVIADLNIGSGTVQVVGRQITLMGGSSISSFTPGEKSAGSINLTGSELIQLTGFGFFKESNFFLSTSLNTSTAGSANAGNINLKTQRLILENGATILANSDFINQSYLPTGSGGDVNILASDSVEIQGGSDQVGSSALTVSTKTAGNAGNLNLNTAKLIIADGGKISAETSGIGEGGTLNISGSKSVEINGTGIDVRLNDQNIPIPIISPSRLTATSTGSGNAGNLNIATWILTVQNGGEISVSSFGSGNAGNVNINTDGVILDQGKVTAETASGEGGNININASAFLLMRNNSLISTTAGTEGGGGNGGNIDINTRFLVAIPSENSDIIANAFTGNGGNINITATAIFGIGFQKKLTPLSDITASSTFGQSGIVNIGRLDVDPQSSLLKLPTEVVDAKNLILQGCSVSGGFTKGEFIITGRGGLPPDPLNAVEVNTGLGDLGYPSLNSDRQSTPQPREMPIPSNRESQTSPSFSQPILEAQGWIREVNGKVVLTANSTTVVPYRFRLNPTTCYDFRTPSASSSLSPSILPNNNSPAQ